MRFILLIGAVLLLHSSRASDSVLSKSKRGKSEIVATSEKIIPRSSAAPAEDGNTGLTFDLKEQPSLNYIIGNLGGKIQPQRLNNNPFIRRPRGIIRPVLGRRFRNLGNLGGRLFRSGGFFKIGNIGHSQESFESGELSGSFQNSLEYDYSEESSNSVEYDYSDESDSRGSSSDSGEGSDSFEYYDSEGSSSREFGNSGESSGSFEYLDFDYDDDSSGSDHSSSTESRSSEFGESGENGRIRFRNSGGFPNIRDEKIIRFKSGNRLPDKIKVPSLDLTNGGYRLRKTSIVQDFPSSVYKGNLNYKYSIRGKDPKRKYRLPIVLKSLKKGY